MAHKRMFSRDITASDAFRDLYVYTPNEKAQVIADDFKRTVLEIIKDTKI